MNKNKKTIPDDKYRVIKIGKEAMLEFLYESFKDKTETFFDVSDSTTVVTGFDVDWEKGEFICVARNEMSENEHLQFDVDIRKLLSEIGTTTDTLFRNDRYIELSKTDVEKLTDC